MVASVDLFGNLGATVHDTLAAAARSGPVAMHSPTGALVVLRHHDVEELAHDARLGGLGLTLYDMMGITDGPLRDWYGRLMFANEGEVHRRLRLLVSRAFTPRAVEALRDTAAELAADIVAPIARDAATSSRRMRFSPCG